MEKKNEHSCVYVMQSSTYDTLGNLVFDMCVLSSPMLDGYLKPPSPVSRDRLSFCLADMEMPALPALLAAPLPSCLIGQARSGGIRNYAFFFWQKKAPLRCANPGICTAAFPATWVDSARPAAYHGHCCAHLPNPTSGSHAQGEGACLYHVQGTS